MSFLGDIFKKLTGEWDYGSDKQKSAPKPVATTRTTYSQPVQPAQTVSSQGILGNLTTPSYQRPKQLDYRSQPLQQFQPQQLAKLWEQPQRINDFAKSPTIDTRAKLIQQGIDRKLSMDQISANTGLTKNEIAQYTDKYAKGYGAKHPIEAIGNFLGDMAKSTADIVIKPVATINALANPEVKKGIESQINTVNQAYKNKIISKAKLEEEVKRISGDIIGANYKVTDNGVEQMNSGEKFVKSVGDFVEGGVNASNIIPIGLAFNQGKKILLEQGFKAVAKQIAIINAKQALIQGTAMTGSDILNKRGVTLESIAMNYGAPFILGTVGELAGIGVNKLKFTKTITNAIDNAEQIKGGKLSTSEVKTLTAEVKNELIKQVTPQVSKTPTPFEQALQDAGIAPRTNLNPKIIKTVSEKASEIVPIDRGFVSSVQGAKNVNKKVKTGVTGTYTPKTNDKLMGEAKALLSDGATIDFKNTKNLDQKVAATIQEALNQQKVGNHQAAADLFNNLSEHGTELGRGVQAFSLLENMSPESISLSVAGKIKKFNLTHPIRKIPELDGAQQKIIVDKLTAIDLLKGKEKNIALNELDDTISSFIPSSIGDKALAVWKAGLLTSLRTHERNFIGNAVHGLAETIKDIPAAGADMLMKLKTGKRSMSFSAHGMEDFASRSTWQQMKDIVSKGYDPNETILKFDYKKITWGNNPIERGLKKYTDIVFRTLGASDKPFYNAAMARSLYDQAGAAAINASKRGNKAFIENLVKSPTEDMIKIAIGDANVSTFKNKNVVSKVVTSLKREMDKTEAGKILGGIIMPFTGVPSSIAGQMVAYSPIGLMQGIARTGAILAGKVPEMQRLAAQEVGRGVVGTGLFALGAYLTQQGLMTGQPKDAKESKQWELEGKQANSIMIGGQWRSINSVGPEALVILAGSKLAQGKDLGLTAANIGKDFTSQTFLQGMSQPLQALQDPERYAASYIPNQIASVIPNIVKDTSKAFDPTQRETKGTNMGETIINTLKAGTPGARNTLLPKRDVLGNELKQEPTGLGAFVDLFNSKTPIRNTVVDELSRLNAVDLSSVPAAVSNTANKAGVKLTPQELDNLEKYSGGQVSSGLDSLINSESYKIMADEQKQTAIGNLTEKIKTQAKLNLANGRTEDINISAGVASDDPKLTYQQHLDAYNQKIKNGTINGPDKLTTEKSLAKEAITSQYSSEVKDFYNLSNANKNAYFKQDPAKAQELYDQSKQMDSQLTGTNVATTKYNSEPVEQWRDPVSKVFPASEVTKMLWVIQHESGGNPTAVGDGGAAYGLFQDQHIPSGASVEEQLQNAFRLYTANKVAGGTGYGDWGEGTSYNGKKFGALGNNPYPGDAEALAYLASAKSGSSTSSGGSKKSGGANKSIAKKTTKDYKLFGFTQANPQSVGKNLRKLIEKAVM